MLGEIDTDSQDQASSQPPSGIEEKLDFITKEGASAEAFLLALELQRGLEDKAVQAHLKDGILNYIIAVGVLVFACKDIDDESVSALLSAIDAAQNTELLRIVRSLHYRTYSIYINSFYFMMALGMEPTLEGVMNVARAMDARPDVSIAQYSIDYCKKFNSGELNSDLSSGLQGEPLQVFKRIEEVIYSLFGELTDVVMKESKRLIHDKHLSQFTESDLLPFIAAIGLLGFSGVDPTSDGIEKVIYSVGISKNEELLKLTGELHVRNHIAYLIALFFLLAVGIEPSVERLLKIIKVLGVTPDVIVADYVVALYKIKKFTSSFSR